MKEIKIKLVICFLLTGLGLSGIIFTYKKNKSLYLKLNSIHINNIRKQISSKFSNGCNSIFNFLQFNEQRNFVITKTRNFKLKGSMVTIQSLNNLFLHEVNLENVHYGVRLRGYIFEDNVTRKCLGMVL